MIDKTDLAGYFTIDLRWGTSPSGEAGPSFFTAIQEQLRLDAEKQPTDIFVIDAVQKPTPAGGY